MRHVLPQVAALAICIPVFSITFASPAWASGTAKCAFIANSNGPDFGLRSCTDEKSTSGAGSAPISALSGGSFTISWDGDVTGTTDIDWTEKSVFPVSRRCPTDYNTAEWSFAGKVVGGTGSGLSVRGRVSANICYDGSEETYALRSGTVFKL